MPETEEARIESTRAAGLAAQRHTTAALTNSRIVARPTKTLTLHAPHRMRSKWVNPSRWAGRSSR